MRRKKALHKDYRMEIRKSLNRFLSILLIVAMGVAFYSGIQSAAPDMKITEDSYFDGASLMDIRVISTLGLTEEDLDAIRQVEGVAYVEGSWQEDVLCGENENRKALRLESLPEAVNTPAADAGRLPEQAGEIFLDSDYAVSSGYQVGDTLQITYSGDGEDSLLTRDTYTVCGYGSSPMYIAFERGSTTVGNGELSGFAYILPEEFDSEVYTNAYVLVEGARELTAYTEEYDGAVAAVLEQIEEIADGRCELRYRDITEEAESELAEARQELEDGKQELADAKQELAEAESEAESELAEARAELLEGESELEEGRQELLDARDEVSEGEQELADAEKELEANEAEVTDGLDQLEKGRQELLEGESTLESSAATYADEAAAARKQLQEAQATLNESREELERGWEEYRKSEQEFFAGKEQYEEAVLQLQEARDEYEDGMMELGRGQAEYDAGAAELAEGQAEYDAGAAKLAEGQAEYDAGAAKLAEGQARYDAGAAELAEGQAQYEEAAAQLVKAREEYEAGTAQLEEGRKTLEESQSQIEEGRAQYESGQEQLAASQKEYDAGAASFAEQKVQYEVAAALLEEPLAEYEAAAAGAAEQRAQYEKQLAEYEAQVAACTADEQAWQSETASYQEALPQADVLRQHAEAAGQTADSLEAEEAQASAALEESRAALQNLEEQLAAQQQIAADPEREESERAQAQAEADRLAAETGAAKSTVAEREKVKKDLSAQVQAARQEQESYAAQAASLEQELATKKQKLDQTAQELTKRKAALDAAREVLAQTEQALAQGEKALSESKTELDAQSAVLAEAKTKLDAGEAELAKAKAELDAGRQSLEELAAQLTLAEDQLEQGKAELEENEAQLEEARTQIEDGELQLAQSKAELDAGYEQLAQSRAELDAGYEQLAEAKAELDAGYEQLAEAKAELDAGYEQLAQSRAELDAGYEQLAEAKAQIDAGQEELDKNLIQIEEGEEQLREARKQLEEGSQQIEEGQKEIDDGYRQLEDGQKQLNAARRELDLGWSQWNDSQAQLADGQRQLTDARDQISEARTELEDAIREIADGEQEIEENEQKLADGWEEYEEGKQTAAEEIEEARQKILDAEEELADAEQKIADGEEELRKLEYPEWYVYDRDVLPENTGYGENAERMSQIGKVFPAIFFLVAALISLTTMTRMVEEQRTQIGTMKALGYSTASIASKYLKYAFTATLAGSIIGVLFGEKVLPWVIINAYGIMYRYTPRILLPYNWEYGLLASGAAMLCTVGAALSASFRALQDVPAALMRPPAPKQGKRVLLEYVPFLWKHLSFSWKSTIRNLMRYKKRCMMTVLGIGGCMGLLLVGYGLRDSIMDIAVLQFDELQHYDAMVVLDDGASEEARQEIADWLEESGELEKTAIVGMQNENVRAEDASQSKKQWEAWVVVPETMEDLDDFFTFRDRESGEQYALDMEGAIVTEKLADKLGLEPGDVIVVENGEKGKAEIPISAVCENYLSHYIYISSSLYEAAFGDVPQYNSILITAAEGHKEELTRIGSKLLEHDGALSVTYTYTMEEQVAHMLGALDIVIIVLIVSAGLLAFVVLYNLNNININERKRELATIKVLGFYDGEVAAYVYRENILLTIVGAVFGVFIGRLLHLFTIGTVEVDSCMFGRNIDPLSYLYAVLFTIGFSVVVNGVMYFKLKKIDMVESLKSVE